MAASPGRQKETTRIQILEAATLRFADQGFSGTRLEDVGEDVGIGRSAVLYHFGDKRLLYRAVLDRLFSELLGELRTALMREGTLAERLEAATGAFVDFMGQHPTAARLSLREAVNPDPKIREEIQNQSRPFLTLLDMIFAEGERSGAFRPLRSDPLHFLSTIVGSTLFYVAALPTFVGDLPYDLLSKEQLEAHKRDVLDITRRLLGIRGPRPVADNSEPT